MSKAYLGAFVAIAAIAVGAVDYINQAKAAGSAPGRFGVGDYVSSISGRFIDQKAAIAAATERQELRAMAPRDLLPEPPEGWSRHAWGDAENDLFGQGYDIQKDDFFPDEIKQDPTMKALASMDKAARAKKDAQEVLVYEKPGTVVAMRLQMIKPGGGGISGAAMNMVANNLEAMSSKEGFAIVKGVTFREEGGLFGAESGQRDYRVITGRIGKEVKISTPREGRGCRYHRASEHHRLRPAEPGVGNTCCRNRQRGAGYPRRTATRRGGPARAGCCRQAADRCH